MDKNVVSREESMLQSQMARETIYPNAYSKTYLRDTWEPLVIICTSSKIHVNLL